MNKIVSWILRIIVIGFAFVGVLAMLFYFNLSKVFGNENFIQQDFDNYVNVAQQQMDFPVQQVQMNIEPDPWYYGLIHVVETLIEMGAWGWGLLGCLALGVLYVGCFSIGKAKKLPQMELITRVLATFKNLLKGK